MNAEEKQALIERCEKKIKELSKVEFGIMHTDKLDLLIYCEAIAALSAQPVKLPKGFSPAIGDIFDKSAPVMRRDSSDGKWLHKADVAKILNDLGYQVQE